MAGAGTQDFQLSISSARNSTFYWFLHIHNYVSSELKLFFKKKSVSADWHLRFLNKVWKCALHKSSQVTTISQKPLWSKHTKGTESAESGQRACHNTDTYSQPACCLLVTHVSPAKDKPTHCQKQNKTNKKPHLLWSTAWGFMLRLDPLTSHRLHVVAQPLQVEAAF